MESTQKSYAITLNVSLSKLPTTIILRAGNYTQWAIGIKQSLKTLCLEQYLTEISKPPSMSEEEDIANRECITNFLLNRMEESTAAFVESKIKTVINGEVDIIYEPSKIWSVVRDDKAPTSEAAIFQLENVLEDLSQDSQTSLKDHLKKFREAKDDLFIAGGTFADGQLARRLIKSIHADYNMIITNIFDIVKPLTYDGVDSYLLSKEKELGNLPQFLNRYKNNSVRTGAHAANRTNLKDKCTSDCCACKYGKEDCFKNPKNAAKKTQWQKELIKNGRWRGPIPSHLQLESKGAKHRFGNANVDDLTETMHVMTIPNIDNQPSVFNTDYVCSNKAAQAPLPSGEYGLADSESSHHMFNNVKHFDVDSLYDNPNPEKRLNLTGGTNTLSRSRSWEQLT